MNIVTRYNHRLDPHDSIQTYKLLKAGKYIIICTLGFEENSKRWIPGTFKNKRVRKALKINKKNWKRLTGGKPSFDTQEEVNEIIKRIRIHLANLIREE